MAEAIDINDENEYVIDEVKTKSSIWLWLYIALILVQSVLITVMIHEYSSDNTNKKLIWSLYGGGIGMFVIALITAYIAYSSSKTSYYVATFILNLIGFGLVNSALILSQRDNHITESSQKTITIGTYICEGLSLLLSSSLIFKL